jgi:hypothetical protein
MKPPVSAAAILQIKEMAAQGAQTRDIARHLGLSVSTVHKVRQGYYDHRLRPTEPRPDEDVPPMVAVWCRRCRCHVYPPCQACRLRAYQRRRRVTKPRPEAPQPASSVTELQAKLDLSVAQIGLPLRIVNYLQQRQVCTVNELLHCTPQDLLRIPNFAMKTLEQVYRCLARLGFQRKAKGTDLPLREAA